MQLIKECNCMLCFIYELQQNDFLRAEVLKEKYPILNTEDLLHEGFSAPLYSELSVSERFYWKISPDKIEQKTEQKETYNFKTA